MIQTTFNIIGSQICELWQKPCTYSRLLLAPVVAALLLVLGTYIDATFLARMTSSHSSYQFLLNGIALANIILTLLVPFYVVKSIIELMRYQVLDEAPHRYFGLYWVKQSYLFISYIYLIMIYAYFVTMIIFNPISDPFLSGLNYLIGIILGLVYVAYILTAYPMNMVAVATDVHVDFFKIFKQIGAWRWSILIINILNIAVFALLGYLTTWSQSMGYTTPVGLIIVVVYMVHFITMGSFAKVFKLYQESR